jgi:ribonuclease HI
MRIDAAQAARLEQLLQKLLAGKTLAVAAAEVGIGAAELVQIAREFKKELNSIAKANAGSGRARAASRPGSALVAFADGGSRGNPGKAACAAVVTTEAGEELLRRARTIGKATNNVAEYEGVRLALELCAELNAARVTLKLDSELVVRQLEGRYKVKNADLLARYDAVRVLISGFDDFTVEHVPRAQNMLADKLVNAVLDGKDLESI